MCAGTYGSGQGLVALTDRRLLFIKTARCPSPWKPFHSAKSRRIKWSSGPLTGTVTVFASGTKAEIKKMNKDDGRPIPCEGDRARTSSPDQSRRTVVSALAKSLLLGGTFSAGECGQGFLEQPADPRVQAGAFAVDLRRGLLDTGGQLLHRIDLR